MQKQLPNASGVSISACAPAFVYLHCSETALPVDKSSPTFVFVTALCSAQ